MRLKLEYLLLSPESTPATTSGSSAPAPSSAPDVADKVTDEPVVDGETNWDEMSQQDDDVPTGDEAPSPSEETAPQEGEKPPVVQKPGEKPQAPAQAKPGEQPPEGEKPPETPQPLQDQPETSEQKKAREDEAAKAEEKAQADLVKYYAIPEEMAERLRTEPELVLPEMAAKVHQAVFKGMQQYMQQAIPQFLHMQTQVQEANTKSREAFYGRWPSLKGHDEQVLQVAGMFRQMNPKATPQERLEQVGKMVCAALGIPPDPVLGAGTPPPAQKRGVPPSKPGFKPGNPSGSSSAAPPPSDNPFTQMAEEFEEEDRG